MYKISKEFQDIQGAVSISGSKSESNRLILLRAYTSYFKIFNLSDSDDTQLMLSAIESDKKEINKDEIRNSSEFIFIVGMPRSGSTLLESILSMRNDVYDLNEINILEESFVEYKQSKQEINLAELYRKKVMKYN